MVFWCYILQCADGSYYTGHTDLLERRFGEHQAGGCCDYTSSRLPVRLAWCQEFPTRLEALEAERRIKPWSRRKKEALIAGDWAALSYWAKPPRERMGASTSLGTNGGGAAGPSRSVVPPTHAPFAPSDWDEQPVPSPFAPSAVEGRPT